VGPWGEKPTLLPGATVAKHVRLFKGLAAARQAAELKAG